ncbi:hypothetical protein KRE40_06450 [Elizabethkingia meningoseptica]|uniref:hypothetical protein n=1 Tax=Elizabethkingia meningoseptica TaxID=238 RepID=UPI0023B142B2|nr:hypothetical protein [Elizabethkingia meningoseptica]MDE5436513.1 hypothetical protein [Elizabethkingia meningoseptica]MDE5508287.1 hypothetical protein [Elizabethkingia meningoseptica]MDE5514977.1 hypothetical protein [Elizabethkingia meningoseptica]MDE5525713.1 hypothetical protein [Elizabethkingia meningoseptica]MDE5529243.1 hypothetical protein [Elizabethkingia meningoseptica]
MRKFIFILAMLCANIAMVFAIPTKIMIRAKARDAKFIGSSLGGAYVIVRNKVNQQILAEGKTTGGTGNTDLIMKTSKTRGTSIVDDQTAGFIANMDIYEPTFVSIEVISPFNNKQAQAKVSTELWVIPGKDIVGDGIIMEIPGYIIDILKPRTHQYLSLSTIKDKPFQFQANIVMMCGCVIEKGGVWNSDEIEVKGILKKDGKYYKDIKMSWVSTNMFEGEETINSPGNYELTLYAYHEKTGNTGVDKVNYVIY